MTIRNSTPLARVQRNIWQLLIELPSSCLLHCAVGIIRILRIRDRNAAAASLNLDWFPVQHNRGHRPRTAMFSSLYCVCMYNAYNMVGILVMFYTQIKYFGH